MVCYLFLLTEKANVIYVIQRANQLFIVIILLVLFIALNLVQMAGKYLYCLVQTPIKVFKYKEINLNFRKFAVCREDKVLIYQTPGHGKEFNPFVLQRTFYGAYDETTCLDWSSDSRVLIAGSKDMSSRVHATERFSNLICYVLGGHNEEIIGCFFEKNSLNVSIRLILT